MAISIAFLFAGCGEQMPDFHPKLVDVSRDRFLVHELSDKKNGKFTKVGWESDLSKLDGHYCATAEETALWMAYARRMKSQMEKK